LRPVGTGLGLALVGRLATGMGGWARATMGAEGGAAFIVGVPLAEVVNGTPSVSESA
jgi:two-component system, OmpR family, sensor kinase